MSSRHRERIQELEKVIELVRDWARAECDRDIPQEILNYKVCNIKVEPPPDDENGNGDDVSGGIGDFPHHSSGDNNDNDNYDHSGRDSDDSGSGGDEEEDDGHSSIGDGGIEDTGTGNDDTGSENSFRFLNCDVEIKDGNESLDLDRLLHDSSKYSLRKRNASLNLTIDDDSYDDEEFEEYKEPKKPKTVSPPQGKKRRGRPPKNQNLALLADGTQPQAEIREENGDPPPPKEKKKRGRKPKNPQKLEMAANNEKEEGEVGTEEVGEINDDIDPDQDDGEAEEADGDGNGTKYKCKHCTKAYDLHRSLQRHYCLHHPNSKHIIRPRTGNYPCLKCPEVFARPSHLRRHGRQAHSRFAPGAEKRPRVPCLNCNKTFLRLTHLRYHVRREHPGAPVPPRKNNAKGEYPCAVCNKIFIYQGKLDKHLICHIENRPRDFLCNLCGKGYLSDADLRNHQNTVHAEKPTTRDWLCTDCGKFFTSKLNLHRHSVVHKDRSERPSFTCDLCGIILLTKIALNIHRNCHTRDTSFTCEHCGKSFLQMSYLRQHVKNVHANRYDYHCNFEGCTEKFNVKTHMLWHQEKMHNNSTYTCEFDNCQKTFKNRFTLEAHVRRLHRKNREDYVFKCHYPECEDRFNSQLWLDRHIQKVHEIGYECSMCEKRFENSRALWKHKKHHHKNNPNIIYDDKIPNNNVSMQIMQSNSMSNSSN